MKLKKKNKKYYYLENSGFWFVVMADSKRIAWTEGLKDFSKAGLNVSRATPEQISDYIAIKGINAMRIE